LQFKPSYIKSFESGKLSEVNEILNSKLFNCDLCNNLCYVNRNFENGDCSSGTKPIVSSYCIHYGEEPILVGSKSLNSENGVGNIFFGNCNLKCVYCQNYQISQNPKNEQFYEISIEKLSDIMIELQNKNVNSIRIKFTVNI
jgi:putative pyruvate formate lyase activating enzyme